MKSIHSAAALFCAFAALASVETRAAVFHRLVFANSYELPSGVSPDGSTVVTTGHVWTSASGLRVIVGYGRGPSGNLEGFVVVIPEPSTVTLVIAASVSVMLTLRLTVRTRPKVFQSPQAPRVFRPGTTETKHV